MSSPRSDAKASARSAARRLPRRRDAHHSRRPHPGQRLGGLDPGPLRLLGRDRDLRLLLRGRLGARLRAPVRERRLERSGRRASCIASGRCTGLISASSLPSSRCSPRPTSSSAERHLRHGLNLGPFLDDPARMLLGYATLTYVPNYFDILPMYLVILALIPLVMAAARLGRGAVAALVGVLYLLAYARLLDLPAEPWSERVWFFNPFSWQLLFFLGFAFGRGWLVPPGYDRRLMLAALARRGGGAAVLVPVWLVVLCRLGRGAVVRRGASGARARSSTRRISRRCASCISWRSPISPIRLPARAGGGCTGALRRRCSSSGARRSPCSSPGSSWRRRSASCSTSPAGAPRPSRSRISEAALVLLGVAAVCEWFKSSPWLHARAQGRSGAAPRAANARPAGVLPDRR